MQSFIVLASLVSELAGGGGGGESKNTLVHHGLKRLT